MKNIIQIIKGLFNRNEMTKLHERDDITKFTMKELTDSEFDRLKKLIITELCEKNRDLYLNEIGKSFERVSIIAADEKYINTVWAQFVIFSTKKVNGIPDKLLNYINANNYRTLFNYIKNWTNKELKKAVDERSSLYTSQVVCKWILDRYDPDDIPALLLLGQTYRAQKDYKEARDCFRHVMKRPDGFNGITSLAECYNDEIVELLIQRKTNGDNKDITNKINELNRQLRLLYISNILKLKEKVMDEQNPSIDIYKERTRYISLVCKYARWNKAKNDYDECIRVLNEIPKDYPEYNRVLLEMGLLYQFRGGSKHYNKYYDIKKSIEVLRQAYSLIKDNKDMNSRKSILIPLANSCHISEDYDEAYRICDLVLNIDPNEKNAKDLISCMDKEIRKTA